eukprot:10641541-Heterocapsa_arctica.AAC.1
MRSPKSTESRGAWLSSMHASREVFAASSLGSASRGGCLAATSAAVGPGGGGPRHGSSDCSAT